MKAIDPALAAELALTTKTLCRLWRITPNGRPTLYFTDHDRDVTYSGNVYQSSKSFQASAVSNSIGKAGGNIDVTVLLDETSLEYADLQRGIYDNADAELTVISFTNPAAPELRIFAGLLDTVSLPTDKGAVLAFRGNLGKVDKQLTERYSPTCRADLGDARCTVDLAPFQKAFTVDAVVSTQSFTASELTDADGTYDLGVLLWSTGDNAGIAIEVARSLVTGQVTMFFKPPFAIQVGDTGTITRGCDKTVAACTAYNNLINFRGEPYVPGDDYNARGAF